MSSSRRRGRSSGSPATGRPTAAGDSVSEPSVAEASQNAAPVGGTSDDTETAAIPEVPAEISPETVQAAVAESVAETAEQTVELVEAVQDETAATVAETTQLATEHTADAVEQVTETVEAGREQTTATVEQVAETAMALVAAPAATSETKSGPSFTGMASARFVFVPAFEPLNEINATLLAFARGEGEAAVAHLQALTKAKSPAEAIRLQVSEFQRAADASLTCFSHILRSANRFGHPVRWS
jgi:ABC-type transport system involved in cytochrome bd biosynthesis fused ATPase/permease subunit